MNEDVPVETILKYVLVENGQLKSEVQRLEYELSICKRQIKGFKKWQEEYTHKSWQYWLDYALSLSDVDIDREKIKAARKIINAYNTYNSLLKQLDTACERMKEGVDALTSLNKNEC